MPTESECLLGLRDLYETFLNKLCRPRHGAPFLEQLYESFHDMELTGCYLLFLEFANGTFTQPGAKDHKLYA